ncbi:MAG: hypothetical protein HQM08_10155 [Candidatus Riflebacteria bacterium]|nr:hypothetical protein [Candidatus Riflebacteria bacterium]
MPEFFFEQFSRNFIKTGFDYSTDELLISHVTNQLNETLSLLRSDFPLLIEWLNWGSTIFPTVVADRILHRESLSVLDYGGGAGRQYVEITRPLGEVLAKKVQYHLVEMPEFCRYATPFIEQIFKDVYLLRFHVHSEIPQIKVDIVSCTSSLQYSEDFTSTIYRLLACNPEIFLVINTPVNTSMTYSRLQCNLEPFKIPQWVFGINDLDSLFRTRGYKRTFFSTHQLDYPTRDTPPNSETKFSTLFYIRETAG